MSSFSFLSFLCFCFCFFFFYLFRLRTHTRHGSYTRARVHTHLATVPTLVLCKHVRRHAYQSFSLVSARPEKPSFLLFVYHCPSCAGAETVLAGASCRGRAGTAWPGPASDGAGAGAASLRAEVASCRRVQASEAAWAASYAAEGSPVGFGTTFQVVS